MQEGYHGGRHVASPMQNNKEMHSDPTPLVGAEKKKFASLKGSLQWFANQTRWDCIGPGAFCAQVFPQFGRNFRPERKAKFGRNLGGRWRAVTKIAWQFSKKSGMEMKLGEKRQEVKISAISPEFRQFFAV